MWRCFFACGLRSSRPAGVAAGGAARGVCGAANQQQQRTFEVAPRRGVLYDRNLRELAMTVLVDSVYAVPASWARTGE
jgi:hypothetical protein